MILPTIPKEPDLRPESFKWLFMAQQGMGKSSLLASVPNILIVDPDKGCRALPGYVADVTNWQDCLELVRLLKKDKATERYSWIGIDLLNIIYDYCSEYICTQLGIKHPSDSDHGKAWSRITQDFAHWIRDMGNLGLPIMATCHVNTTEITVKGRKFTRYIPAFVGGGARSAYQRVLENFDIIGYLAFDITVESPVKDIRQAADPNIHLINVGPAQKIEPTDTRVIHFQPSQYWEGEDTSRQLPAKVVLPEDWSQDWSCILEVWGSLGK
jgi:hypothetical protein